MEKSYMVVASKYELTERDKRKGKAGYKTDGAKDKIHGDKMVPRAWVEERNAQENNEHYIIDEDKTAEMVIERTKNVKKNAENDRRSKATTADLIDALIAGKTFSPVVEQELEAVPDVSAKELSEKDDEIATLKKVIADKAAADKEAAEKLANELGGGNDNEVVLPEGDPSKAWTIPQLKKYLDDKEISYHKSSKEARLLEIINENK